MSKHALILWSICLVLFGALVYTLIFRSSAHYIAPSPDTTLSAADETLQNLSRIMILPPDLHPPFATVTDKSKLINNPYMKTVENGDQVVFFASLKEAIVYRPSIKKIVAVAPLE